MYDIGLITAPTIQEVNMGERFTRADMAKLMVDYAINILNKTANTQAICNFNDIANESPETQTAIISACQLGLMGIDMMASFYPDLTVDQAQAGTILSRILWGDTYNGADPFYLYHLNALKEHGIISSITPDVLETMESFMLMLYKASL